MWLFPPLKLWRQLGDLFDQWRDLPPSRRRASTARSETMKKKTRSSSSSSTKKRWGWCLIKSCSVTDLCWIKREDIWKEDWTLNLLMMKLHSSMKASHSAHNIFTSTSCSVLLSFGGRGWHFGRSPKIEGSMGVLTEQRAKTFGITFVTD